ncbi:MAG TPA: hypothetical protein VN034_07010 [Sphingopyxis sp.]|nr:hypothetical protein [Sphingopyxis sp.]
MKDAIRLNLVHGAAALAAAGRHVPLVRAIERAAAVGSIREDLRTALAALRLIENMQAEQERGEVKQLNDQTTITGALFTQAIILYARATISSGKRPSLLNERGLSDEELATHNEVRLMRNSVIGHFGRGDDLEGGPVVREAVIVSFTRSQRQIGVYTVRAQHKVILAQRLALLLERRLAQIAERQDAIFDSVQRLLSEALQSDRTLGPLLLRYPFDADAFCGNSDAARNLRAQLEAGELQDMDYVVSAVRPAAI